MVYVFTLIPVVKNYSSTPPFSAYFFRYSTILSSVPTPVINNDRSLRQAVLLLRQDYITLLIKYEALLWK